jgi:signal transduction histidine kinase
MHGESRTSWAAWSAIVLAVIVAAAGEATSLDVVPHVTAADLLEVAVVAAFCLTGVVVLAARPGHLVGWLLLAGGSAWAIGNAGIDLASHGLEAPGKVPAVSAFALGGAAVRSVGWYVVVLGLPIAFPHGRLFAAGWRWLPRAFWVVVVASVVDAFAAPGANLQLPGWRNPLALPDRLWFVDSLAFVLSIPLALVVAAGAVLQLRARWWHAASDERQQLAMFALAAGLPVLAGPLSFLPGAPDWLFAATVLPLPVAVGFAVLARGLYDLRTAANRTLVWVLLSGIVAAVYALVLAVLGEAFGLGAASWFTAVAVGVVAVAFAPIRDLLQRGVNRVLYGRWDEPAEVLTRVGRHLEATADVPRLLRDVVDELASLGLDGVRIEDAHGHLLAAAAHPAGTAARLEEIPLSVYGERVGSLRFAEPPTRLRPADRRLLEDVAVRLGAAVHQGRLTGELQRALERVVLAREEERRRLRRDLHDGLGPALAGHLLRLGVVEDRLERGSETALLVENLREEMRATVLDVRRVVEGLHPPALDELGLAGALEQAVQRLGSGKGLPVEVDVAPLPPLPAATEVAAFRIATEAVANVVRHSAASRCRVRLRADRGTLRLVVADDGVGLAMASSNGNGLHTMRERAEVVGGSFRLVCDGGTVVVAELPISGGVG